MNVAQYRRSSKQTAIQSYQGSISNSSVHTTSPASTCEDLFNFSEQNLGGTPCISHRKSFHSLEKPTFRFRNQSQSTVGNIPSFGDGGESPLPSTPRPSVYELSTLPEPSSSRSYGVPPSNPLDNPLTERYRDSQPFAVMEIPTADNPPTRHPSSLPPLADRTGISLSYTVPSTKDVASLAGAASRQREKKKEDKANDADIIVKLLQRICRSADPTQLCRNLVKIGQG